MLSSVSPGRRVTVEALCDAASCGSRMVLPVAVVPRAVTSGVRRAAAPRQRDAVVDGVVDCAQAGAATSIVVTSSGAARW